MSQLNLFPPRVEGLYVSVDNDVNTFLTQNGPVAVGVSGGKDSSAAAWATFDYLDKIGHTGKRLLIHADLGKIEWADSLPICERLAERLGVELAVVRRAAGGMVERWYSRWDNNVLRYADLSCVKLILPWSTPSMRFCTSELKTAIICRELIRRFPGCDILSVLGIRREESPSRAKRPISSFQQRLESIKWDTAGLDWNSILNWLETDVWLCHELNGLPIHEAYTRYKSSRVSCAFCIMSSLADLIKAALCPGNEDVYRELCELEIVSTFSFQDKVWLSDVAPRLLTEEQRERLVIAKIAARSREIAEQRIPNHLLYEKGWPNVMPTYAEAIMLSEVRQEVAGLVNINVGCKTPELILGRYEQLMILKEQKAK
jgi:3'-phosphoadenosine 5'-phosphosulfate sulfotransferase (PAPS reductase)/FAD synthetase